MKTNKLVFSLIIAGFAANAVAAPTPKPPPAPQDVNVVNTPNVTVTNPQSTVTVDNTTPIPVSLQATNVVEYVFAGASDDLVPSYALGSQSQVCQNKYGPTARWATTKEVVEAYESGAFTTYPPPGTYWVLKPIFTHSNGASGLYFDPYLRRQTNEVKCFSLTNDGGTPPIDCYAATTSVYAACSLPK